jgi:hypothetical protein
LLLLAFFCGAMERGEVEGLARIIESVFSLPAEVVQDSQPAMNMKISHRDPNSLSSAENIESNRSKKVRWGPPCPPGIICRILPSDFE